MPIMTDAGFAEDAWTRADAIAQSEGVVGERLILPLDLLRDLTAAEVDALSARCVALGVDVSNDADLAELRRLLPSLDLIALNFPSFADGRAFSQARRLRGLAMPAFCGRRVRSWRTSTPMRALAASTRSTSTPPSPSASRRRNGWPWARASASPISVAIKARAIFLKRAAPQRRRWRRSNWRRRGGRSTRPRSSRAISKSSDPCSRRHSVSNADSIA